MIDPIKQQQAQWLQHSERLERRYQLVLKEYQALTSSANVSDLTQALIEATASFANALEVAIHKRRVEEVGTISLQILGEYLWRLSEYTVDKHPEEYEKILSN